MSNIFGFKSKGILIICEYRIRGNIKNKIKFKSISVQQICKDFYHKKLACYPWLYTPESNTVEKYLQDLTTDELIIIMRGHPCKIITADLSK